MIHHALALLLACLLLWAASAPHGTAAPVAMPAAAQDTALACERAAEGSASARLADELPPPGSVEPVSDAQEPPTVLAAASNLASTRVRPGSRGPGGHRAPYLDGPQRPPCTAAVAA